MSHQILLQDDDILVVSKAHDLLSVPGKNQQANLLDILLKDFPNLRLIHRLDMATSGIIVFALNYQAQKVISRQFEQRQTHKRYNAIVLGNVVANCGHIHLPLLCDWPNRPKQKVDWHHGKTATTYFEVVHRQQGFSQLHLHPITGRSHQLRVHCQALGHPIAGDRFYAPDSPASRLCLHAEYLGFSHPKDGRNIKINCPAPFNLSDFC